MIERLIIHPTAHTSSLATAAASFITKLSGAGTMAHELPFQCSARVSLPWATSFPIAQMSFSEIAVTVFDILLVSEIPRMADQSLLPKVARRAHVKRAAVENSTGENNFAVPLHCNGIAKFFVA